MLKFASFRSSEQVVLRQYVSYGTIIYFVIAYHGAHGFLVDQMVEDNGDSLGRSNLWALATSLRFVAEDVLAISRNHLLIPLSLF